MPHFSSWQINRWAPQGMAGRRRMPGCQPVVTAAQLPDNTYALSPPMLCRTCRGHWVQRQSERCGCWGGVGVGAAAGGLSSEGSA